LCDLVINANREPVDVEKLVDRLAMYERDGLIV